MTVTAKRKRSTSVGPNGTNKQSSTPKKSSSTKESTPREKKSILTDDSAFPRGGGSVLTPLELKQATNEAVQDVLFSVCSFFNC